MCVVATGHGPKWSALLTPIYPPTQNSEVVISSADVNAINRRVHDDLHHMQTEIAGSIRGSRPTDQEEATAIIGNMDHYVRTMASLTTVSLGPTRTMLQRQMRSFTTPTRRIWISLARLVRLSTK